MMIQKQYNKILIKISSNQTLTKNVRRMKLLTSDLKK